MKHSKTTKKIKFSTILLIVLIIIAIVIIAMICKVEMQRTQNEEEIKTIVSEIEEEISSNDDMPYITYKGYQVIGIIKIPKINIEYPILIECTENTLNISISRFGNGEVNKVGNLTLAGHNYINDTMFGAIDKLENGDEIVITDLYGEEVTYAVFDTYLTDPNDTSILNSVEEDTREVTLLTCKNRRQNRYIVKAREI